jgi:hypothetical protein
VTEHFKDGDSHDQLRQGAGLDHGMTLHADAAENDGFDYFRENNMQRKPGWRWADKLCLGYYSENRSGAVVGTAGWAVAVPYWAIMLPTAVLPLLRFRRWRTVSRRHKDGSCLKCGYDLRSHAPGSSCPECGRLVK